VSSVAITSDDKRILSGSGDKTLKIWDSSTGVLLATLIGNLSYNIDMLY
jgi:WD40 repeat protein